MLFFLIVQHTMAIAFKIRVDALLPEFLTDTLKFSEANFITELFQLPDQIFFTSDHLDAHLGHPENRVLLPILDKEALVTYYAVYRQSDLQRLSGLF